MTPSPREVHDQEQLVSGLRHLAMLLHHYYHVLCEEGFSPEQAMSLTDTYQGYLCESDIDEDTGS